MKSDLRSKLCSGNSHEERPGYVVLERSHEERSVSVICTKSRKHPELSGQGTSGQHEE